MMPDKRQKDRQHEVVTDNNLWVNISQAQILAVLMDIRDELKSINGILHCQNFMAVPFKLDRIARNTHKPRKRRKSSPTKGGQ